MLHKQTKKRVAYVYRVHSQGGIKQQDLHTSCVRVLTQ
jgi:hypothetical protein